MISMIVRSDFAKVLLGMVLSAQIGFVQAGISTIDWPRIAAPNGARQFVIDDALHVNGAPMQISGFIVAASIDTVIGHYRATLGQSIVENMLGTAHLLARAFGEFFVTVRLEKIARSPLGGTRALVVITRRTEVPRAPQSASQRPSQLAPPSDDSLVAQWRSHLPPGTRVLSHMTSVSDGRPSRHLIFTNAQSLALNDERIVAAMQARGLVLATYGHRDDVERQLMFFQSDSHEANIVLTHVGDTPAGVARSVIVVHEMSRTGGAR